MNLTPEQLTAFSYRIAEGQALLSAEACAHLVQQLLIRTGVKGPVVARNIGMDRRTINRYQNGDVMPALDTATKILDDLGYDLVVVKR